MVSVVVTQNLLESTPEWVCQYFSVIIVGAVSRSVFDVVADHIREFLARPDGKPHHDYLRMPKRVVKAN